jgi:hypothetical protein
LVIRARSGLIGWLLDGLDPVLIAPLFQALWKTPEAGWLGPVARRRRGSSGTPFAERSADLSAVTVDT